MSHHALVALAAAVLACARPQGAPGDTAGGAATSSPAPSADSLPMTSSVELRLDRDVYASRADVQLTMVNHSARALGYNSCRRVVEREAGAAWRPVPEPTRVCTMELRTLAGGQTVTETTDLPTLTPGRYRITLAFSDESGEDNVPVRAQSAGFTVR